MLRIQSHTYAQYNTSTHEKVKVVIVILLSQRGEILDSASSLRGSV